MSGRVNPRGFGVAVPPTVPLVTVTVTWVEWDRAPLVPVTFTLEVASGVNEVVVTLRVEVPNPPGLIRTDVGFSVVIILGELGTNLEDSKPVPEKPVLPRVI